jgi:hypothetical protein
MRVHGIEHVALAYPAGRIDEVRAYYIGLLGLSEIDRPASIATPGVWLDCGAVQLHFSNDPAFNVQERPHTALLVDGLRELVTQLQGKGYTAQQAAPLGGRERFFTWDPFGNKLELVALPA